MKTIFVLTGPKGCGKTYIGTLLEQELGIPFFRVENLWLGVKEERFSDSYVKKGFSLVEREIDSRCKETGRLITESTAAHEEFYDFLVRLKRKYHVKLICIAAPPDLCLARIKTRDPLIHIPVSDDRVEEINRKALSADLSFDLVIQNEQKTDEEIIEDFSSLLFEQ